MPRAVRARLAEIWSGWACSSGLPHADQVRPDRRLRRVLRRARQRERAQVWGVTLPPRAGRPAPSALQPGSTVWSSGSTARGSTAAETDLERRPLSSASRPRSHGSGRPELRRFVEAAFGSSSESQAPRRAASISPAARRPAPRSTASWARSRADLGLERPPPLGDTDRSFFLTRLLRDVVFGEAGFVARDHARERRERSIRDAAWRGCDGRGWSRSATAGGRASWPTPTAA